MSSHLATAMTLVEWAKRELPGKFGVYETTKRGRRVVLVKVCEGYIAMDDNKTLEQLQGELRAAVRSRKRGGSHD